MGPGPDEKRFLKRQLNNTGNVPRFEPDLGASRLRRIVEGMAFKAWEASLIHRKRDKERALRDRLYPHAEKILQKRRGLN